MHNFFFKKYYFINKFEPIHLANLNEKVSIIYRNYGKKTNIKLIKRIKIFCDKHNLEFFLSNNIKLAIKLNLTGVYIPSFNKDIVPNCFQRKKKFRLLGSAHNLYELNMKKKQKINEIFISPVFKTKKNKLGIHGFIKLSRVSCLKNIALGGINRKNLKFLNLINADGYAAINYYNKKKGP